VLDIGCGNGLFLMRLAEAGLSRLFGWDFDQSAVTLAREISARRGFEDVARFYVRDLTKLDQVDPRGAGVDEAGVDNGPSSFDVIHDKGTFDLFYMTNTTPKYVQTVYSILRVSGLLAVTSCNATREELEDAFCSNPQCPFGAIDVLEHRSFTFGGHSGQIVSTVAFQRLR